MLSGSLLAGAFVSGIGVGKADDVFPPPHAASIRTRENSAKNWKIEVL